MGELPTDKRILVIDDEEDTARSFVSVLSRAGYIAEMVLSGEEAVTCAKTKHFDLIFLDLHLPRMSGLETYRLLKSGDSGIKVCIMTGWPKGLEAQQEEYFALMREGAVDKMLRKPFSRQEILNVAKELLEL